MRLTCFTAFDSNQPQWVNPKMVTDVDVASPRSP